jgi:hypothetical protein
LILNSLIAPEWFVPDEERGIFISGVSYSGDALELLREGMKGGIGLVGVKVGFPCLEERYGKAVRESRLELCAGHGMFGLFL